MNTPNLLGTKNSIIRSFFNTIGRNVYWINHVTLNPINNPIDFSQIEKEKGEIYGTDRH